MSFYPKHLTFIFDGFSATNVAEIKFRFEIEQGFKLLKSLEHQLQSPKRTKVQNQPKAVFWIQSSFAVWHRLQEHLQPLKMTPAQEPKVQIGI
jgi:hypothetical protein